VKFVNLGAAQLLSSMFFKNLAGRFNSFNF